MTAVATPAPAPAPVAPRTWRDRLDRRAITLLAITGGFLILSIARILTDADDLTSSGTFGIGLELAVPIGLAGLAGLFSERSGTVNIGLEGMMVLGTVCGGWAGWQAGPWACLVAGAVGGMLGGLLHGLATITFGVDHIVSGFAINILAPGVARFIANEAFTGQPGGSVTNSPAVDGAIGKFTFPFLSGGQIGGWDSPDILGWIEDKHWILVSDIAGFLGGLTRNISIATLLTAVIFVLTAYVVWHTPFGLRLRSSGEKPGATDSLGVSVIRIRYYGVMISGALAGLGGAILVFASNRYQENQVAGRGFFGLATLIFGNWYPAGVAAGAGLFGYANGITLRTDSAGLVEALLVSAVIALVLLCLYTIWRQEYRILVAVGIMAAFALWSVLAVDEVNNQFVYMTPYVVTLLVVSFTSVRMRPPAAAGKPWRKGQGE
jgi:simple sugar transport system permease protein